MHIAFAGVFLQWMGMHFSPLKLDVRTPLTGSNAKEAVPETERRSLASYIQPVGRVYTSNGQVRTCNIIFI